VRVFEVLISNMYMIRIRLQF